MKKRLVILLLCIHGLSATGATLHFHYCCGKLYGFSLGAAPEKNCGNRRPRNGKKCCAEKRLSVFIKDAHQLSGTAKICFPVFTLPRVYHFEAASDPVAGRHLEPAIFAPPPRHQPLHVLYCVYRI